jgi:hypothetical protein
MDPNKTASCGVPLFSERGRPSSILKTFPFGTHLSLSYRYRIYKVKEKKYLIGTEGHGLSGVVGADELISSQMALAKLQLLLFVF